VEREVPQTKDGTKDAPQNVVRLWDWIGPRDELVPFGRSDQEHEPEAPAEEGSAITAVAADAPASASDFWGERAASVHDALQAPAEDWAPADEGAAVGGGIAKPVASTSTRARPLARLRLRWRFALGAGAVVAVISTALALAVGGNVRLGAGTGRTQVASVLTDGMDRVLSLDLPVVTPRPSRTHPALDRHRLVVARVTSHPRSAPQRVRYAPPAATTIAAVSHPQVQAATAQAAPANPPPTTTSDSVSRPSSTPNTSSAPVSATGQSGALGPIESPNG
jgi:hypothetical protein